MDHPDHQPLLRPRDRHLLRLQPDGKQYKLDMLQFNFQIHPWLPILNGVHQEEKKIDRGTKGGKNKEKKKAEENNTKDDHEEEGRENEEETKVKENMGEKTKEEADKQKANQKVDQEVEGTMKTDEIELDDLSPASPDQEEKGDSDPEIRELEST